jgi:ribosomal protein S14
MAEFSHNYGYDAARSLTARFIILDGETYANREWIKSQGGKYGPKTHVWKLPVPSNTRATADLLYGITSRGMSWKAALGGPTQTPAPTRKPARKPARMCDECGERHAVVDAIDLSGIPGRVCLRCKRDEGTLSFA